ncbi:glyoxal oxidase N-terminus-domain-containing protein [Mycena vitilis]|nr:glyoxal oxidase N-terminus-domain-containing protein [Mycena vitilis]
MIRLGSLLSIAYLFFPSAAAPSAPQWKFTEVGNSGIVALESIVVSPTLAVFFDRATNDPLKNPDGKTAWGALWNMETNTVKPLELISDSFCASGALLSNGTMVSVGGNIPAAADVNQTGAVDGRMGLRLFGPCLDPNGDGPGCTIFEDLDTVHLATTRWYTSTARIFDGSLMIVGGVHEEIPFYNTDPVNSFEFFPSKDGGVPRPSAFLNRTVPVNLFPRVFALPDGKIFILANNQSIIYDIETNTETPLPDLPNGQRVSNPFDGTAALLPLSPPLFTPEILACGGSTKSDLTPVAELSSQDPATSQCARITLTPAGIKQGWVVEHMPQGRMMPEMILLPNGQVLITNGAASGYAAVQSIGVTTGQSNADHPLHSYPLYADGTIGPAYDSGRAPDNRHSASISLVGYAHASGVSQPLCDLYHAHVLRSNILLAGSNPNGNVTVVPPGQPGFSSELRVETLDPPFFSLPRPTLSNAPSQIHFNQKAGSVDFPAGVSTSSIKVALMDLGFSSHAFHSSGRLVFMDAVLSPNKRSLTITSPPNNRVFPPGPAFIFVTAGDTTSVGAHVMVGSGANPPVADQGVPLIEHRDIHFSSEGPRHLEIKGDFLSWNFDFPTAAMSTQTKGKQPRRETIEVEDDDARLERIQRVLEQLNTTSPSAADTAGRGVEHIFNTAGPSDAVPRSEGDLSELLARVQAFLPQIEASNTALAEKASVDPRSVDIENVDGDEKVIQMNLGLGVFEDRTGREGESESEEEGSDGGEDEDGMEEDSDESSSDTDGSSSSESSSSDAESDDSGAPNLGRTFAPLPKRALLARPTKPLPTRGGRPEIVVLSETATDA